MLVAWNTQDVEAVLAQYSEDVVYVDPNTRGEVRGRDAFRRYLSKLFSAWTMSWESLEVFPFSDREGGAFRWRATLAPAGGGASVEAHGLDIAIVRDGLVARNEVYFDRALLAPLLAAR